MNLVINCDYLHLPFLRSNARFLWKRIPHTVKQGNVELEKIWSIYNHLWNNDVTGFFKAINYEWSNNVAELMFELKGICDYLLMLTQSFINSIEIF